MTVKQTVVKQETAADISAAVFVSAARRTDGGPDGGEGPLPAFPAYFFGPAASVSHSISMAASAIGTQSISSFRFSLPAM